METRGEPVVVAGGDFALGYDVGTGSTKAGLVDREGRLVAVARHPHKPTEPRPGWSETDPEQWWEAIVNATGQLLDEAAVPAERIAAIGLSGQMHGVVVCRSAPTGASTRTALPSRPTALPSGGEAAGAGRVRWAPVPLRSAVLWSDRRSQPYLQTLAEGFSDDELLRLANPIVAGMAGPTLASLRRLEPELVAHTEVVLQPKDWIRACLTGRASTEPSDASGTLLWDFEADHWSQRACEVFGVDGSWLSPVEPSEMVVGGLHPGAAAELGLLADTPVCAGGADTAMSLFGSGVAPGDSQLTVGSGGQLARIVTEPRPDPSGRTHLFRGVGAQWYALAAIQNAGLAVDWALRTFGLEPGSSPANRLVADAMNATPPGSDGVTFHPYLTGERTPHLDAGLAGRWSGLRSGTNQALMVRSVFEGVAFALADGLDALRDAGHPIDGATLAGGGTGAVWWRQLLADSLNIPLVPQDVADASVCGAGLVAWRSIGVDVGGNVAGRSSSGQEPVVPDPATVEQLAPARDRFRRKTL